MKIRAGDGGNGEGWSRERFEWAVKGFCEIKHNRIRGEGHFLAFFSVDGVEGIAGFSVFYFSKIDMVGVFRDDVNFVAVSF